LENLEDQLSNVVTDCSKLCEQNGGKLVQQILTKLGRLAADLGLPIAVGVSRREIELGRADNSVAEWSEP